MQQHFYSVVFSNNAAEVELGYFYLAGYYHERDDGERRTAEHGTEG